MINDKKEMSFLEMCLREERLREAVKNSVDENGNVNINHAIGSARSQGYTSNDDMNDLLYKIKVEEESQRMNRNQERSGSNKCTSVVHDISTSRAYKSSEVTYEPESNPYANSDGSYKFINKKSSYIRYALGVIFNIGLFIFYFFYLENNSYIYKNKDIPAAIAYIIVLAIPVFFILTLTNAFRVVTEIRNYIRYLEYEEENEDSKNSTD